MKPECGITQPIPKSFDECRGFNFREKLRRFYEENGPVLLPKEVVLKDRLDANSRHELLLYRFVCQLTSRSICDNQSRENNVREVS